jgi:hypothetical protein
MATPSTERFEARASCTYCSWSAHMTGDDPIEIATFLRARIIEHVDEVHPDRVAVIEVSAEDALTEDPS